MKVWPWSSKEKLEDTKNNGTDVIKEDGQKKDSSHSNGTVANGNAVTAGGGDKKTN